MWTEGKEYEVLPAPQRTAVAPGKIEVMIVGVKAADFLAAATSFGVDNKIKTADDAIVAMQIPGTPAIVVNGKYLVNMDAVSSDQLIGRVTYLVKKETPSKASRAASRPKPLNRGELTLPAVWSLSRRVPADCPPGRCGGIVAQRF